MMSDALKVWSIEFNEKSAFLSCYDQMYLMHESVTYLLGNSKLDILNPYSLRHCGKILMLPCCDKPSADA